MTFVITPWDRTIVLQLMCIRAQFYCRCDIFDFWLNNYILQLLELSSYSRWTHIYLILTIRIKCIHVSFHQYITVDQGGISSGQTSDSSDDLIFQRYDLYLKLINMKATYTHLCHRRQKYTY